ncbi:MAG: tetraacyldisaccharide 4'-kinase, partial [Notoacmeibacter sp.]|nr:tetraacyldisaccharide 4'-kinase [Notoacmeibacter sp.]
MISESPPFWWEAPGWQAWALSPLSWTYGRIALWKMDRAKPVSVPLPVLCIGNFTVGGTGKTPVSIAIAKAARAQGLNPGILSRGHGGAHGKPHLVDLHHDTARHVGDEPLLLAAHAPVAVSADRQRGAALLAEQGCDFLIMDDGFQSRRIRFDHATLVVDSRRGLGNGHVLPGGPVRAPLLGQLRHANSLLVMGGGTAAGDVIRRAARAGKPVFHAAVKPVDPERFSGRKFVAFAGIGEPEKFYDTLEAAGGFIATTRNFADHHHYSDDNLRDLQVLAGSNGAELVTTAKDAVRLHGGNELARTFLSELDVLDIE